MKTEFKPDDIKNAKNEDTFAFQLAETAAHIANRWNFEVYIKHKEDGLSAAHSHAARYAVRFIQEHNHITDEQWEDLYEDIGVNEYGDVIDRWMRIELVKEQHNDNPTE